MIRDIHSSELIKSPEFVRETAENLYKKLKKDSSKRIILAGGRGVGKSVVLRNMESIDLGSENKSIYMSFDPLIMFDDKNNEIFDNKFINHYYEMLFCEHLLSYIHRYYEFTFNKYFKDYDVLVSQISQNTINYINHYIYGEVSLERYLEPKELSQKILNKFKEVLGINSLTLIMDRFDHINGSNETTQKVLSNYFDMFDKIVITTDDHELNDKNNRGPLLEKGYSFTDVDYGKDESVIKEIIRKRICMYNETVADKFSEELITDKIYQSIIDKTKGNIYLVTRIISEVTDSYNFKQSYFNSQKDFNDAIEEEVARDAKIKSRTRTEKLYL